MRRKRISGCSKNRSHNCHETVIPLADTRGFEENNRYFFTVPNNNFLLFLPNSLFSMTCKKRAKRFELSTTTLATSCSTNWATPALGIIFKMQIRSTHDWIICISQSNASMGAKKHLSLLMKILEKQQKINDRIMLDLCHFLTLKSLIWVEFNDWQNDHQANVRKYRI